MITPDPMSLASSIERIDLIKAAQEHELSDLGVTISEDKIQLPNDSKVDVQASWRRQNNQDMVAGSTLSHIPAINQVVFPFAAYMPTLTSNATGTASASPLETQQRFGANTGRNSSINAGPINHSRNTSNA